MSKYNDEEKIIVKLYNDEIFQLITSSENSANHFSKILLTSDDKFKNGKEKIKEIKINKNSAISILKIFISELKNVSSEKNSFI